MQTRREVEAKFKLKDSSEIESAIGRLFNSGFIEQPKRQELDYSLDTPEWLCRKNGLVLRFRRIIHDSQKLPEIRLTLKEKRRNDHFQDNDETEFSLSNVPAAGWRYVEARLLSSTGLVLPDAVISCDNFAQLIGIVRQSGFSRHRILLEKRRSEYSLPPRSINVTVDTFPDGMGTYLEIEAYSPEDLKECIHNLELNSYEAEALDYGEILKRHKKDLPEIWQRTAVFDDEVRQMLLDSTL